MKGDFTRWTFEPGKHYSAVLDQQGRVGNDAGTNEQREIDNHLRRKSLRDIIGITGAPAENPGFGFDDDEQGNLIIRAGHCYVDGILCENEQDVLFTEQPGLPGQELPASGRYLAYFDVWKRHVTAIEDPDIREVALGGPDTTTRKQTVWGIRLFEVPEDTHCLSPLPDWEQAIAAGDGRLAARANPPEDTDDLCLVPPGAGFTGLENQLYRVEIRQAGSPGEATFVWDRDNGSIVFPIEEFLDGQPTDRIRLGTVGKWDLHALEPGDVLEITDDRRELNGEPGLLFHVERGEPGTGIIVLDEPVDGLSPDLHPKARRWSGGEVITVSTGEFIPLEKGVQVRFEGNRLRTGDYWLIPARTATADVEWPSEGDTPLPRPPLGITHHYCRIALLDFDDEDISIVQDCRLFFAPLAQPTLRITHVETAADNQMLPHNSLVHAANLPRGLNIEFSAPLSEHVFDSSGPESPGIHPAVEIQLHLPEPATPAEREFWGLGPNVFFGFRPVTLASDLSFENDRRDRLQWRPTPTTLRWLQQVFPRLVPPSGGEPLVQHIVCTLRVRGEFIWADGPGGNRVFLDGETRANPEASSGLNLPSGNGRPGGDFLFWFWIVSDAVEVPLSLHAFPVPNAVVGRVSRGGSPVEGATVTLRRTHGTGLGTEQVRTSDVAGRFGFPAPSGRYLVIAEAFGMTAKHPVRVPLIRRPTGGSGGFGDFGDLIG